MRSIQFCIAIIGLGLGTWACAPWWRHAQPELAADVSQPSSAEEAAVAETPVLLCHERDARVFDVALVLYQRGLGDFDDTLFDLADLNY